MNHLLCPARTCLCTRLAGCIQTVQNVRDDVAFILSKYGSHAALLRVKDLPVFYVYDSYHVPIDSWKQVLLPGGKNSVRGTHLDGIYIGLYLSRGHERYASEGGFDGLYTYFASTDFSDGTRLAEWPRLTTWARQHSKLFVPCVGPGYDDSRVRPWNAGSWRYRGMGKYYEDMWAGAVEANPLVIAVTSYNEWGEGTQIEAAAAGRVSSRTRYRYHEYGPDEELYLKLTRSWSLTFRETLTQRLSQEREVLREALMAEDRRLGGMQGALVAQAADRLKSSAVSPDDGTSASVFLRDTLPMTHPPCRLSPWGRKLKNLEVPHPPKQSIILIVCFEGSASSCASAHNALDGDEQQFRA